MEPMDINGGRFYARKLTADDRINDVPALAAALGKTVTEDDVTRSHQAWVEGTEYTWAICEQTNVDMLALARLNPGASTLEIIPVGDLDTPVPNDPMLTPVTIADAVAQGGATIRRWASGFLGLSV
ncbi:hypothetical protein CFAEC_03045 [Corynebacterium faecale]|uniref:hypothetical protein n=1 Tax=Corynebacterium faecale TaxID=1758466 RepID=UPI0025B4B18F|nr:hypothetical protein [Corynebacterium faecale]WJY91464.1 hypothetical protein CFAEC_03045 [Corynebacterium faecale]